MRPSSKACLASPLAKPIGALAVWDSSRVLVNRLDAGLRPNLAREAGSSDQALTWGELDHRIYWGMKPDASSSAKRTHANVKLTD